MMTTSLEDQKVMIGEEGHVFDMPQSRADLLKSRGLLGKDLAHLLNGLADLLKHGVSLPQSERNAFEACFWQFTVGNSNRDSLYSYVVNKTGAEGISRNLWMRFARDLPWPQCTLIFHDMPTNVLEELAQDLWSQYLTYYNYSDRTSDMKDEILYSLRSRTDIYGEKSMPPELAFGILIEEDRK